MSVETIFYISLVASVLVIVISSLIVKGRLNKANHDIKWGTRIGPIGWDFKTSWASNLTAIAILATLLAADDIFSESSFTNFSKNEFVVLSLIFALLLPVSPLVYNAFRTPVKTLNDKGKYSYQDQGYIWSFLLASWITLLAVSGQIVGMWILVTNAISEPLSIIFMIVIIVAGAFLIFYVYQSMYSLMLQSVDKLNEKSVRDKQLTILDFTDKEGQINLDTDVGPPLESVPIL